MHLLFLFVENFNFEETNKLNVTFIYLCVSFKHFSYKYDKKNYRQGRYLIIALHNKKN